ncbi:MAG: DUF3311 domain-containing protein [Caldisphaera sp.]|uniref:DUF3311 domain-containing protein n=1 Tax=Caldisphaera sp. TaxID=2060322 RepID=UPI003D1130EC
MEEANKKLSSGRIIAIAILILIPFFAYILYPTYDKVNPTIDGLTFFYWYQTLWLAISGIMYAIAAYLWDKR